MTYNCIITFLIQKFGNLLDLTLCLLNNMQWLEVWETFDCICFCSIYEFVDKYLQNFIYIDVCKSEYKALDVEY